MKAGQKPGVSHERHAKQNAVCQDTQDSVGSLALSTCHILFFTVGTQLPGITFSLSSTVPLHTQYFSFTCALPHPVCVLISTYSLDLWNVGYNISLSKCSWWDREKKNPPPAIFLFFYNHQSLGQMFCPPGNMSITGETDKTRGTIPFYHAPMHKQVRLRTYGNM